MKDRTADARITVRFTPSDLARIQDQAQEEHRRPSDLIRVAVLEYLEQARGRATRRAAARMIADDIEEE